MTAKDDPIIGIDLGTTNSLVAICDEKGSRILKDGESNLIPSVLVFNELGKVLAVGHRAKTLKSLDPKRVLYSVKRLLGKGKKDLAALPFKLPFDFSPSTDEVIRIQVGAEKYSPIELSAEILKRCKFIAENALGRPLKKAVVTVPAYFNDSQRSATAMAGKLAGLQVVRILNEPTAAALAYGFGQSNQEDSKIIAVYDFGGGTFDISILKVTGKIFEVLSTDGDTLLGGDDLDHAIAEYLEKKSNASPCTEEDRVLLLSQAENIKKALSVETKVAVQLQWAQKLQWSGQITRDEINAVMKSVIERTLSSCKNALKAANLTIADVNEIVMVGGSTRVPLVRSLVKEFFKKTPNTSLNPDEVVALGAAIQASILSGETTDALLLDVVPLSLGLETMGGVVSKIIPRNSTIPCAASEMFTTYADNQTAVDLHILQGERELVKDCRSLGKFKLRIPPGPAGLPKIEVKFLMDANGILQVKAIDKKTGESAVLEVSPSFGLSDAEVESMLQAAFENAQRDFAERQLIEAKNQARALIQATEKSLINPLLDAPFRAVQEQKIRPVVKALKIDLESAALEIILTRVKELDFITQELAQAILNRSVSSHLTQQSIESISG